MDAEYIVHHGIPTLGATKDKVCAQVVADFLFRNLSVVSIYTGNSDQKKEKS